MPVLAVAACYRLIPAMLGVHFWTENQMSPSLTSIKVMTWNMHGLGIYDKPRDKEKPEKMFRLISQEDPDILCMIEYYTKSDGTNKKGTQFFKREGYKEYRFTYDNTLGVKVFVGNAIFSKFPLSNFMETDIAENIKMMQCDVTLPYDKKARLFVFHLQSFMLGDKDKAFIEEVKTTTNKLEENKTRTFISKFRKAYVKRARQAELIKGMIANSPHPVIICCDLNDLPNSYCYNTVKANLNDGFLEKGTGFGRTYNMILPTLRIDYIFYDPSAFALLGYRSIKTNLSDHNPVVANLEMLTADK